MDAAVSEVRPAAGLDSAAGLDADAGVDVDPGLGSARPTRPRRRSRGQPVEDLTEPPSDDASRQDLRVVPLFASLSDGNLEQLARTVRKQRAAAGETLCREGERGEEMYVILSGAVTLHKTVDGLDTELGRLESGAFFGEMALIGDAPRSATIVAATDIEYLAIDRETLMRVIAAYPTVALQILKGYNARLAETTERLARLSAQQLATTPAPRPLGPEEAYEQAVEQAIAHGPYPLATLVRKMQVETEWDRKVLQALDIFEVVVKYTTLLLLADYLRGPAARTPELDQLIACAFRRPTLGQLIELSARILRSCVGRECELFVPELYTLHFRPEGGRAPSARAYQALTAYRNRLKHGAEGIRAEEVFKLDFEGDGAEGQRPGEVGVGIKHHLTTVLREVAFLKDYPLVYLSSMTYEQATFHYGYERCTGAYPDFDHGIFVYGRPLENRRLYLLSPRMRVLELDPLFRRRKCPTCGRPVIFSLYNFFPARDRGDRPDVERSETRTAETASGPASARVETVARAEGAPPRAEKLEYLSYSCGHILVEQLSPEQVGRGEGLSALLATPDPCP